MGKSIKFDPDNPYEYPKKLKDREKRIFKKIKRVIKEINTNPETGRYLSFDEQELDELED